MMISNRMMWRVSGFFFTFLLATQIWAFVGKDKVWRHNVPDAEAEARQLGRPLLLHFHAKWCGPCQLMESEVLNTGEVKRVLLERLIGVKIDLDQHQEIAEKYGIDMLPADVIVSPEGKVLSKSTGFKQRDQYVASLLGAERTYLDAKVQLAAKPKVQPKLASEHPAPPQNNAVTEPAKPDLAKTELAKAADIIVAMEGYCPVTLWRTRQWVRGKTAFGADYQGVRFYFSTLTDRDDFIADPSRYAPQLLGCDPVALHETERAIAGTAKYAAYFDGELFLFSTLGNRDRFKATPPQFTQTRHVNLEDIERADIRIGMNTK